MPKRKSGKRSESTPKAEPTPADAPKARTLQEKLLAALTCQYLGKTYYEGDTITYKDGEWHCHQGEWVKAEDVNPNHLAAPQTAADTAALQVTCPYGDKTFYENQKVCYENVEFICTPAGWKKTGSSC